MRKQYIELLGKIEKALEYQHNFDERLKLVVKYLKIHVEKYNWVGIYLKSGEELLLHDYIGKPTAHTKIPISEGILIQWTFAKEHIVDVCQAKRRV